MSSHRIRVKERQPFINARYIERVISEHRCDPEIRHLNYAAWRNGIDTNNALSWLWFECNSAVSSYPCFDGVVAEQRSDGSLNTDGHPKQVWLVMYIDNPAAPAVPRWKRSAPKPHFDSDQCRT